MKAKTTHNRLLSIDALRGFDMFWIAGGWSLLLFALFYMVIDVLGWQQWSFPFRVIGMNAIAIYMAVGGVIDFYPSTKFLFGGVVSWFGNYQ